MPSLQPTNKNVQAPAKPAHAAPGRPLVHGYKAAVQIANTNVATLKSQSGLPNYLTAGKENTNSKQARNTMRTAYELLKYAKQVGMTIDAKAPLREVAQQVNEHKKAQEQKLKQGGPDIPYNRPGI